MGEKKESESEREQREKREREREREREKGGGGGGKREKEKKRHTHTHTHREREQCTARHSETQRGAHSDHVRGVAACARTHCGAFSFGRVWALVVAVVFDHAVQKAELPFFILADKDGFGDAVRRPQLQRRRHPRDTHVVVSAKVDELCTGREEEGHAAAAKAAPAWGQQKRARVRVSPAEQPARRASPRGGCARAAAPTRWRRGGSRAQVLRVRAHVVRGSWRHRGAPVLEM